MWDYLDERGRETIVTDVSVTHPTPSAPTVAVPGVLAPESEPGSPRGIRDELGDVTGDEYTRYADTDAADSHPSAESFTARIDQWADTAVHLLGETDPDLGIVEAQATDAAFHLCDDERVNPSTRAVGSDQPYTRAVIRVPTTTTAHVTAAVPPDPPTVVTSQYVLPPSTAQLAEKSPRRVNGDRSRRISATTASPGP